MYLDHRVGQRDAPFVVLASAIAFVSLASVSTVSAQECAKANEIKRLAGTWVEESYVLDGECLTRDRRITLTFEKNTVTWNSPPSGWPGDVSIKVKNEF